MAIVQPSLIEKPKNRKFGGEWRAEFALFPLPPIKTEFFSSENF